jgi:MFS transporter, OFA family, oxalate/formate antiporter
MCLPIRWRVAVASVIMQMVLGGFYAWSVFAVQLVRQFGWTTQQVTTAFTLSVFGLGTGAFWGGLLLNRKGPRMVAMLGGFLWATGVLLASLSAHRLWWLYLSYGIIGGSGLGVGYVVPSTVLLKWFPDHRGLMTGLGVGGFGAGTLIVAPLASRMILAVGVMATFAYLGVIYLAVILAASCNMKNPTVECTPKAKTHRDTQQLSQDRSTDYSLKQAAYTWQFWALCLSLSLNSMAGISVASQASPLFIEMGKVTPVVAAGLVGIIAIGNGAGRVLLAWVSDLTTRRTTLLIMFVSQAVLFWILPSLPSVSWLLIVTFMILMCYGGGYGLMPSFAADYFGVQNVGPIFGLMLLTWTFAAAFGPLVFAHLRATAGGYRHPLHVIAGIMAISSVLPIALSPPRKRDYVQTSSTVSSVESGIRHGRSI